jgi:phosphatidylserine/phosphatidylglycerophosphate/cardiolipin synthase-like enzyme
MPNLARAWILPLSAFLVFSSCSSLGKRRAPQSVPVIRVVQGEDYAKEALPLFDEAEKSIDVLQFSFSAAKFEPRAFADKLIEVRKTKPAVRIRVFLQSAEDPKDPVTKKNREIGESLKAEGIEILYVTGVPNAEHPGTNHAKALAIDGKKVLAGSTNWTHTSIALNNEINVLAESEVFGKRFTEFLDELAADSKVLHTSRVEDGDTIFITDDGYHSEVRKTIQGTMDDGTLDISLYYFELKDDAHDVETKEILDDLIAAHQRGVKIRIFIERNVGFAPGITCANRRVAKRLNEAGIEGVYFDRTDKISHSKLVISDKKRMHIGSANWYGPDFKANHQLNWILRDPALAESVTERFSKLVETEGTLNTKLPAFNEATECPPDP